MGKGAGRDQVQPSGNADLAPVKGEGKDEKLSRNNSDHSAAPREPWQFPKVLMQRTPAGRSPSTVLVPGCAPYSRL